MILLMNKLLLINLLLIDQHADVASLTLEEINNNNDLSGQKCI